MRNIACLEVTLDHKETFTSKQTNCLPKYTSNRYLTYRYLQESSHALKFNISYSNSALALQPGDLRYDIECYSRKLETRFTWEW